MMKIAVLLTCYNRKDKTLRCLKSINETFLLSGTEHNVDVFLTDDGCTDGTSDAVRSLELQFPVHVLNGSGSLYWNGGMNNSWRAAIEMGAYDGYLWLNDDTIVLEDFWHDISIADKVSVERYGKRGIYVGSTCSPVDGRYTYGGFNFTTYWTLKNEEIQPDNRTFRECQCAHGNITYISDDVVEKMGVLCDKYVHGGGDHDYTYLAYKAGFPVLVMPHYAGICDNDHSGDKRLVSPMTLKERIKYLKSPFGLNLNNTLLFNSRCFPLRVPFVWLMGYMKAIFPKMFYGIYRFLRR